MRKSFAKISLSALVRNYQTLKTASNNAEVFAVVKANAYGHGVLPIVKTLERLGAGSPNAYAVAYVEEGIQLRAAAITKPILVFESPNNFNCDAFSDYGLIPTVFATEHLSLLRKFSKTPILAHLKVDTGMNRLGIKNADLGEFIAAYKKQSTVRLSGIYTHFAESDAPEEAFTKSQIHEYINVCDYFEAESIPIEIKHAANSGGILFHPDSRFDAVRPGIALYGYYPGRRKNKFELLPVMEVNSVIESIKFLEPGQSVSYSRTFKANSRTRIASIPIGYADGISRLLSNRMQVIINDSLFPQRGIITMDRILIEIGDSNVRVGDEVVLLGSRGEHTITAWDWCDITGTIPYEVTCLMSPRLERQYIK